MKLKRYKGFCLMQAKKGESLTCTLQVDVLSAACFCGASDFSTTELIIKEGLEETERPENMYLNMQAPEHVERDIRLSQIVRQVQRSLKRRRPVVYRLSCMRYKIALEKYLRMVFCM